MEYMEYGVDLTVTSYGIYGVWSIDLTVTSYGIYGVDLTVTSYGIYGVDLTVTSYGIRVTLPNLVQNVVSYFGFCFKLTE